MLKNCVSGISIWLMFIWSIITYISFMAGGEYGYFGEFFWNIVMLVFIYGVYSNSAMGIEGLNAPFYIVGLPLFGLFTFVFHKLYKYFYYIYFWDEYDYVLVLYQISIMIILSFATSIVWTVARAMDSTSSSDTIIDIGKTNTSQGYKASADGPQITVEMKNTTTDGVPAGYVRYDHKPKDTSKIPFTLCCVKYNNIPLTFDQDPSGTPDVTAVYVYYKQTDDPDHEFPLIVCVVTGATTRKYYKRGQTWNKDETLNSIDPDGATAGQPSSKLETTLKGLKDKYEVKLEKDNQPTTGYKARPDNTSGTINVTTVGPDAESKFKGFKHSVTGKINRVTIHGHVIRGIQELDDDGYTISDTNGGVFVYFPLNASKPELHKPLLICLSPNGNASNSNKWYKRVNKPSGQTGYEWKDANTEIGNQDPGTIDPQLAKKLGPIKDALTSANDTGYTQLGVVVKLDYAAKGIGTSSEIKYRTGDKQVTVNQLTPGSQFKGYKHDLGAQETINKIKIHGNEITQIGIADLKDKRYVFVYFENGDANNERPYLICLSIDGTANGDNKWYQRQTVSGGSSGYTWRIDSDFTSSDDPNRINTFETKIDKIKSGLTPDQGYPSASIVIDASVTPTNTTEQNGALYGIGSNQIKVEKKGGDGKIVPRDYIRYKHTATTTTFNLDSVKHNDIPLNGIQPEDTVQAVYVYYKSDDTTFDFPLIVCVAKQGGTWNYYKRGNEWKGNDTALNKIDPESPGNDGLNTLKSKLDEVKAALEPYSGLSKLFGIGKDKDYHILHWSPIFLVALSLGTVYFFYPAISPYQLVDDPFDGKKIELWIQAISATPHIAFAITQLCKKGPGRLWKNYVYEYGNEKLYAIYHATWIFFIPYIICIYIFFSMMHFPDGRIGKYFRASVFRTGVLCVFFAWVQEFMEAVGFGGGMGAQVSGRCGDTYNDDAGTIFGFMFLVFMIVSMFTEDLYMLISRNSFGSIYKKL